MPSLVKLSNKPTVCETKIFDCVIQSMATTAPWATSTGSAARVSFITSLIYHPLGGCEYIQFCAKKKS